MESFESEQMNKLSSRQKDQAFVPIEEVPDDKQPDPFQALIAKEEAELDPESPGEPIVEGHPNDLSRPSSYMHKGNKFDDTEPFLEPHDSKLSPEAEEVVKAIEEKLLNETKRDDRYDASNEQQSQGKRGRKPVYKDKIGGPTLDAN